MKKTALLSVFLGLFVIGYAQPSIMDLSYPDAVDIYDLYEISFSLGIYSNPYDPDVIDVYAEFVGPNQKTYRVNGFYYEGYSFTKMEAHEVASPNRDKGWRVRFSPDQVGNWTFVVHAVDRKGKTNTAQAHNTFRCNAVDKANGFVSVANKRYLKRLSMVGGKATDTPFFPIGPNVAWYGNDGSTNRPKGIYDYERYIDAIAGSANYMHIWLNRYQYLSLYGPEYTQKEGNKPIVYFNTTLNQKDAAELDHIVTYAAQHGINLMPCIFTFGDFFNGHSEQSRWDNNPFHTILGLSSSTEFFTDKEAKRIARNLIRYIVARWGYATNIASWELWNEVDNIPCGNLSETQFADNIVAWHNEMAAYIRSIDPFHNLISTSHTTSKATDYLFARLYETLDFVQIHTYGNIQKAKPTEERCIPLLEKSDIAHELYPDKPCFVGEFGFGQSGDNPKYADKDPHGIDMHNCLWSSLFSNSMGPASFWYWDYLDQKGLLRSYQPMLNFSKNLPLLSDTYTAKSTSTTNSRSVTYPNGIQTYYLVNNSEDHLFGWCQDAAFSYQSLRRLTDVVGENGHFDKSNVFDPNGYVYTLNPSRKPRPSSWSNVIKLPVENQPVGTEYIVKWYDGETGLELKSEQTTAVVKKKFLRRQRYLPIVFPTSVRNLKSKTINNTFGDAAFIIQLKQDVTTPANNNANGGNAGNGRVKPIKKG